MSTRVARFVGALSILLAFGFVALAGAGGWYYWTGVEIQGENAASAILVDKAKEQIPKVFGYDY
jgi:Mce-associated membrane protein